MFVIKSCQKIEYNALFMMIFIPVSNFGDQPLKGISKKYLDGAMAIFPSASFLTNHNTALQSTLPCCAFTVHWLKYLQKDKIYVELSCSGTLEDNQMVST